MKDIAIIGAGGYGCEVACIIRQINEVRPTWRFIGFYDDNPSLIGTSNSYGPVLGAINSLNSFSRPISAAIAIGSPNAISDVVQRVTNPLVDFPNLFAPSVVFLDKESLTVGKGNIIGTNCFVSCNVHVGNFNIFNGYIPIGHDVVVGNFNVVMPSCNISGGVHLGDCNFLGVQSVVLQNIRIGNNTRIGSNSVVMRKTKDGHLYIGNPAKRMDL